MIECQKQAVVTTALRQHSPQIFLRPLFAYCVEVDKIFERIFVICTKFLDTFPQKGKCGWQYCFRDANCSGYRSALVHLSCDIFIKSPSMHFQMETKERDATWVGAFATISFIMHRDYHTRLSVSPPFQNTKTWNIWVSKFNSRLWKLLVVFHSGMLPLRQSVFWKLGKQARVMVCSSPISTSFCALENLRVTLTGCTRSLTHFFIIPGILS